MLTLVDGGSRMEGRSVDWRRDESPGYLFIPGAPPLLPRGFIPPLLTSLLLALIYRLSPFAFITL